MNYLIKQNRLSKYIHKGSNMMIDVKHHGKKNINQISSLMSDKKATTFCYSNQSVFDSVKNHKIILKTIKKIIMLALRVVW